MRTESYDKFWQRIHTKAKERVFPLRVMFELTYRCNFKCKHCYVPASFKKKLRQEINTKEIFSILDQLADMGCFYLGFTGGEPFLRQDIFAILRYAKKKGFQVIIYTNGSLIDKDKADKLMQINPNKVDITIPAMRKHVFEGISQVADSRGRVFKAVELLHQRGIALGFKTCMLKGNEDEIKDIQSFAASLGALHRLNTLLLRRLNGSRETLAFKYRGDLSRLSGRQINMIGRQWHQDCDNLNYQRKPKTVPSSFYTDKLFKCGAGQTQAAITPFGELKMCLMIDYPKYKILDSSLGQAWHRLVKLVAGIKPDGNYKCRDCELNEYCKWCPAKGWLYNGKFTSCDSQVRRDAKARRFYNA